MALIRRRSSRFIKYENKADLEQSIPSVESQLTPDPKHWNR